MEEDTFYSSKPSPQGDDALASSFASSIDTNDFQSCQDAESPVVTLTDSGYFALQPLSPSPFPPSSRCSVELDDRSAFLRSGGGNSNSSTTLLEQLLFFGCGLGSSICYIATLSSLVYFKLLYGAESFVYLNLAVYLPLLPISLAQARWDQYYDIQFQSRRTYLVRALVGFGLGLMGTLQMIQSNHRHHHNAGAGAGGLGTLVVHASLQGTGGAILYGTLNQMASFVDGGDGRKLKATVSAGTQSSALIVLAVSLGTGFGVHDASCFSLFLWSIVGIEALCLMMFLWLLLGRPTVVASMIRRDSSLMLGEEGDSPTGFEEDMDETDAMIGAPLMPRNPHAPSSPAGGVELSFSDIFQRSSLCCLVLAITLVPSFLVGSWFTNVQTKWMSLASWLFYVRIASDFVGRLVTIVLPPTTLSCITWTSLIRLVPVALFFIHTRGGSLSLVQEGPWADGLSIGLVAIIAFLSGYLVTGCLQLAPQGLPWEIRDTNSAKQASLLTVAFSISAIGGLLSSFILMALGA